MKRGTRTINAPGFDGGKNTQVKEIRQSNEAAETKVAGESRKPNKVKV